MSSAPLVVTFFTGWLQILLYGKWCNLVLYGTSIFLLRQRKGFNRTTAFQFISITILFSLATMLAIATTTQIVGQLFLISNYTPQSSNATAAADSQQNLPSSGASLTGGIDLYATNVTAFVGLQLIDFTAFCILLHRCYAMYNRNWKILIAPMIIILADIGVYSAALPIFIKLSYGNIQSVASIENRRMMIFSTVVIALNTVANGMLTLLIAGKIWCFRKRMHQLVGRGATTIYRKYDYLIAMTLESGLLIPVTFIVHEVSLYTNKLIVAGILGACISQIIAFAPLLIMAETTGHEVEVELQTSRPLVISVTRSQTVSVSGGNDESRQSELGSNDMKQFRYAV
ncbi:hypothetical protein Moror_17092 [Moniliophthora roreri MCA 2997]|uniref:G protein-coupled receptor n=1 Tax=Moniliophthora roreri (strain MCA 2997) TaxID=1381753 RepID=V2YAU3_MONRO|nr:hypothetical protein Moror_17092 [Moniliophthora roreri MCA 2997]